MGWTDPKAKVCDLPVGSQQRVEIIKALYRGANVLILDEPTAVLAPQEAEHLGTVIRTLSEQGKTVIFITHKLMEARSGSQYYNFKERKDNCDRTGEREEQ